MILEQGLGLEVGQCDPAGAIPALCRLQLWKLLFGAQGEVEGFGEGAASPASMGLIEQTLAP